VTAAEPATVALIAFVAVVVLQRLVELSISARNVKRLVGLGAREHGRGHFPLIVAVHVIFPASLLAEVLLLGARPGSWWPAWLVLTLGAMALRFAAIRALGPRWNVRVWVVPGMPLLHTGPYRFLRHPNYLAVAIELLAAPMVFGAWRTALGVSALNLVALALRIRAEEGAHRGLPAAPGPG
jgi:methyltransferase